MVVGYKTFKGHKMTVNSVTFSSDGQLLASASNDKIVILWNMTSYMLNKIINHHIPVQTLAFNPINSQQLASAASCKVHLWDTESGKLIKSFMGHNNTINSICFILDGQILASEVKDKVLRLWHLDKK